MTIHWVDLEKHLIIFNGIFHRQIAIANRMRFLTRVSSLLNLMASPKHPQSFTGLAMAIQMVMSVMMTMINSNILDISLLLIPNRMNMPMENSIVERATEAVRVIQSGTSPASPSA